MKKNKLKQLGRLARCHHALEDITGFCGISHDGRVHLLQDTFLENFDIDKCRQIEISGEFDNQLEIEFNNATYFCLYEEEK